MKQGTKFAIIAIVCIILFAIAITPVTFQNDTYYTIKIGEHIIQSGEIDMQDPFSWHEGLPYTYPHWLYDVLTYLVYSFSGFNGIYISTIILTAILGLSVYLTNSKLTKNRVVSFVITIASMYLVKSFVAARAQLATFVLFVLTIYFIEMFLQTKKKRYAVFLIIIPILIANLHLAVFPFYFVLYMPYIAEYVLALLPAVIPLKLKFQIKRIKNKIKKTENSRELEERIIELQNEIDEFNIKQEKVRKNSYKIDVVKTSAIKWLILVLVISAFTGFLTPLGNTPYTYLTKTMQGNTTRNINEHLPLTLIENPEFLVLLGVYIGILMFTDTKIRAKYGFLLLGMLYLALSSRRQTSLFVLICSYTLCQLICAFISKYANSASEKIEKYSVSSLGRITIIAIMTIISILVFKPKINNQYINDASYPVAAAEFINNNLDKTTMKLYNEYNYGSYLLFKDIPVFIDSRADLYTPEFSGLGDVFSDFLNISNQGVYYEEKFKEYGITHVMMYKNAKLNMFISRDPNYKELYADSYFVIYERNTKEESEG